MTDVNELVNESRFVYTYNIGVNGQVKVDLKLTVHPTHALSGLAWNQNSRNTKIHFSLKKDLSKSDQGISPTL